MVEENAWGYVRIAGELKKLGHEISPSCVRDLMRKHGFPSVPRRRGLSWKQFIQAHLDVTWAADFFTEEVWTCSGLVTYYAQFFIRLSTRRAYTQQSGNGGGGVLGVLIDAAVTATIHSATDESTRMGQQAVAASAREMPRPGIAPSTAPGGVP